MQAMSGAMLTATPLRTMNQNSNRDNNDDSMND